MSKTPKQIVEGHGPELLQRLFENTCVLITTLHEHHQNMPQPVVAQFQAQLTLNNASLAQACPSAKSPKQIDEMLTTWGFPPRLTRKSAGGIIMPESLLKQ
jgi:hypothetical protein